MTAHRIEIKNPRDRKKFPTIIRASQGREMPAAELTTSRTVDVRLAHIKKAGALIYINAMRRTASQSRQ
jgi:hypothetical protein